MSLWNRTRGDTGDTIQTVIEGISSLAGAEVFAHVKRRGVQVGLGVEVTDAEACAVTVHLGATEEDWLATAAPGRWRLEYEINFADGRSITWPAQGFDTIMVRGSLDSGESEGGGGGGGGGSSSSGTTVKVIVYTDEAAPRPDCDLGIWVPTPITLGNPFAAVEGDIVLRTSENPVQGVNGVNVLWSGQPAEWEALTLEAAGVYVIWEPAP